ncbi:MAG: hypothetical protein MJ198_06615 [Bacteroidales bacterium]|nr:hypothetical protein [Bacteroidales bacterium]
MYKFKRLSLVIAALAVSTFSYAQKDLLISGGNAVSSLVCSNNYVYVTGLNSVQEGTGVLGAGSSAKMETKWIRVEAPKDASGVIVNMSQVNSGSGASFVALDCKGQVWGWGGNAYGQTGAGEGSASVIDKPTQVKLGNSPLKNTEYDDGYGHLTNVEVVYAGNANSFAILGEGRYKGRIVAWGGNIANDNFTSCLGTGSNAQAYYPTFCKKLDGSYVEGAIRIFSGDHITMTLLEDGTVWTCGDSAHGDFLGRNARGGKYTGSGGASNAFGMVYLANGEPLSNIKEIACGDGAYLALDGDGYIWSWGNDGWNSCGGTGSNGQGEGGTTPGRVLAGDTDDEDNDGTYLLAKAVGAGQSFGMAVTVTGKPVAWGGGGCKGGYVGNGTETTSQLPVYVQYAKGAVHNDVILINRGDSWGFYGRSDGSMYAWGCAENGQLGNGSTTALLYAQKINPPSGCAFRDPSPVATLSPRSMSVCKSAFQKTKLTCGFTVSSTDLLSAYKITWYKDGNVVLTGDGSKTSYTTEAGEKGLGEYKVVIQYVGKNSGCESYKDGRDSIVISAYEKEFDVVEEMEFCNDEVVAGVTTKNTKAVYSWWGDKDGTELLGKTTGNATGTIDVSAVPYSDTKKTYKTIYVQETALGSGSLIPGTQASRTAASNAVGQSFPSLGLEASTKTTFVSASVYLLPAITRGNDQGNFYDTNEEAAAQYKTLTGSVTFTITVYGTKMVNAKLVANSSDIKKKITYSVPYTYKYEPDKIQSQGQWDNKTQTNVTRYQPIWNGGDVNLPIELIEIPLDVTLEVGTYYFAISGSTTGSMNSNNTKLYELNSSLVGAVDDLSGKVSIYGADSYGNYTNEKSGPLFNFQLNSEQGYCDLVPVKLVESCPCNKPGEFKVVAADDKTYICPDETAVLSFKEVSKPDNATKVVYEWYKGTKKLDNDNQKSLEVAEKGTYTLYAYDKDNPNTASCQFTAEIEITEAPKPTVEIGAGGDYCAGDVVKDIALTFTGSAPFNFTYTENGGTEQKGLAATATGKIEPASTVAAGKVSSEYIYKIASLTDKYCTADAYNGSAIVNIAAVPTATIEASDEEVCAPETITLTGSSNVTGAVLAWGGDGSGATATQTVDGAGSYTYTLVATNTVGKAVCKSETATQTVKIDAKPVVTISSDKTAVCSDGTINVTAVAKIGTDKATDGKYTWTGATGTGATATVTKTATWPNPEEVKVMVDYESKAGCKADQSAPITVTFNPAPTAPTESNKASYCMNPSGADVTLDANAEKNCTLQWYDGTTKLTKAPTISIKSAKTYTYSVTQIYEGCESDPTDITIVVNDKLKPKISINTDELCIGGTTEVTVEDANKYSVTWSGTAATAGFGSTATAKAPTFTAPSVASKTEYTVHVYVENAECDGENEATITVHPTPTVTLAVDDNDICDGETATITATIAGDDNTGSQTVYTWKNAEEESKTSGALTGANTTATDKTETISYSYTSSHGCKAKDVTTTVTVRATPQAPVTEPYTKCLDASEESLDNYVTKAAGATLNWYGKNETGGTASSTAPMGATNKVVSPAENYYVSQTINGCEGARAALPVTINANLEPVITATEASGLEENDGIVCAGTAIVLKSSGNYTEKWFAEGSGSTYLQVTSNAKTFLGTAPAGTYNVKVEVEDENGCKGEASKAITVNAIPVAELSTPDNEHCITETTVQLITATITPSMDGVGTWTNADKKTDKTAEFTPSAKSSGTYKVAYSFVSNDGCSTAKDAEQTMIVNALPTPEITVSNAVVCKDGTTNKDVVTITTKNTIPAGTFSYAVNNGGSVDAANGSFDPTENEAGTYTITLTYTDANGCTNTATDDVTVYAKPTVSITVPSEVCYNNETKSELEPVVSPANGKGTWTGTVSANSNQFDPKSYAAGSQKVTYTYTDPNGCTNSAEENIDVVKVDAPTVSETATVMINTESHTVDGEGTMTATVAVSSDSDVLQWFEGDKGSAGSQVGIDGDDTYTKTVVETTPEGSYPYTVRSYRVLSTGASCYSDSAVTRVVVTKCSAIAPKASDKYICTNDNNPQTELTATKVSTLESSYIAWMSEDPVAKTNDEVKTLLETTEGVDTKIYSPSIEKDGSLNKIKDYVYYVAEYDNVGNCWSAGTKVTIHVVDTPSVKITMNPDYCAYGTDVISIDVAPRTGTLAFKGGSTSMGSLSGFDWTPGDYSGSELEGVFTYSVVSSAYADGTQCTSVPEFKINAHYMDKPEGSTTNWLIKLADQIPDLPAYTENKPVEPVTWYSTSSMSSKIGDDNSSKTYSPGDLSSVVAGLTDYNVSYWVTRTKVVSSDLSCESEPAEVKLILAECPWAAPQVEDIVICSGDTDPLTLIGTPGDLTQATGGKVTGWKWNTTETAGDKNEYSTGLSNVATGTASVTEYMVSYKAEEKNSKAECWSPETKVTVTVNPLPVIEIDEIGTSYEADKPGVLCYNGGTFMATAKVNGAAAAGGTWSSETAGIIDASGIIDPTNSKNAGEPVDGKYTVKYEYTDGNTCYNSEEKDFWVEYPENPETAKYTGIAEPDAVEVTVEARNIDETDIQTATVVTWYRSANAKNKLSDENPWKIGTSVLDPTSVTDGEVTFYVSQTVNGCTSERVPSIVEIVACPWKIVDITPDETCEGTEFSGMTATAMESYNGQTVAPLKWSWSTDADVTSATGTLSGSPVTYKQTDNNTVGRTTYYVRYSAEYDAASYEYGTVDKECWSEVATTTSTVYKNPTVEFAEKSGAVCFTDGAVKVNVKVNLGDDGSGNTNSLEEWTWSTDGSSESFTTKESSYAYFNTLAQDKATKTYEISLYVKDDKGCDNTTTIDAEKRTLEVIYLDAPETEGFYSMTSQEHDVEVKVTTAVADGAVIHWFGDATTMSDSEKKNKNVAESSDKGKTWATGDAYNRTVLKSYFARQYDATANCYSEPTEAIVKIVPCPIPNVIVDAPQACIYDVASGAVAMTVSTGVAPEGSEEWTERDPAKSEFRFYTSTDKDVAYSATVSEGEKYDPKNELTAAGVYSYYVTEYNSEPLAGLTFNEGCESQKVKTTVTVKETEAPKISPESDAVCEGQNDKLKFKSTLNSNVTPSYWYEEDPGAYGIPTAEGTVEQQMYYTPKQEAPDTYTIYAVRYVDDCYSQKVTATYTIKPIPDAPEVTNNSVCEESNNVAVTAEGSTEDAVINWYADEKATKSLLKNSAEYISKETEPETYSYYATQTIDGCESSMKTTGIAKALYTIIALPLPPNVDYKTSLCEYDENQVMVASDPASGNPVDSVLWYATADLAEPLEDGVYTNSYTVEDDVMLAGIKRFYATQTVNGCEGHSKMITFNVYVKPESPKVVGASICQGETDIPTLSTNLSIDKWWADDMMTTKVTEGYTYTPKVEEVGATDLTYYITRTQNGCISDTVPVTLHVIPTPSLTISEDVLACIYEDIQEIKADDFKPEMNEGSSVKWQVVKDGVSKAVADGENHSITPSDLLTEATVYTINASYKYVYDGIFCTSEPVSMTYTLKERARKPIVFTKTICQGDQITDLQALGSPNVVWKSLSGTLPEDYHGVKYHFQPGQVLDTGTYYYEIYDLNMYDEENLLGCESIHDTVQMVVAPGAHTKLYGKDSICVGSVGESYYTQYESTSQYFWTVTGDNLNYSKDAASMSVRYIDWLTPGVDTLMVYEQTWAGCEGFDTLIVKVAPVPKAHFSWSMPGASNIIELVDSTIQDSLWTTDEKGEPLALPVTYTMAWNYGHQGTPDSQIDTLVPYNQRNYPLQEGGYLYGFNCPILTVTNDFGCKSTYTECIFVNIASSIYVPTAFSPTNPAHSVRMFQPKGFNLASCEVSVYDKWGNLLWYSDEVEDGMFVGSWDGRYDGKMMKSDIYIWKMEATFLDGQKWQGFDNGNGKKSKFGSVTLVR